MLETVSIFLSAFLLPGFDPGTAAAVAVTPADRESRADEQQQ